MSTYTVSLELPECEGASLLEAVEDFQTQARQEHLFTYEVTDNSTGQTFSVDMGDRTATRHPRPAEVAGSAGLVLADALSAKVKDAIDGFPSAPADQRAAVARLIARTLGAYADEAEQV